MVETKAMKSAILGMVVLLLASAHWSVTAAAAASAAVLFAVAAACVWIIIEGAFAALMAPSARQFLPPTRQPTAAAARWH
jgi:hypothetical protein